MVLCQHASSHRIGSRWPAARLRLAQRHQRASEPRWRRAQPFSPRISAAPAGRAVRDSKQGDGPLLTFSHETWMDFLHQFS
ncbi:DUF397 domain-containing protein [Streptomyces griseofuscus]|uniref:DUF397 domain-containing protein n=1 Tax=Streptomyces griseofuscus TaxID=146922 RepID=UPI00341A0456